MGQLTVGSNPTPSAMDDRSPATAADAVARASGGPLPDDIAAMEAALVEAEAALLHDDVPIGAVVVHAGRIIASRHNERELQQDPTAHAEVLALRDAARSWARGASTSARSSSRWSRARCAPAPC